MKMTLADACQLFTAQVNVSHIEYSWDAGHAYSYINHPIMNSIELYSEDDEHLFTDITNSWLYENDNCPPCQISIVDGVVGSGCGCHDHLDYEKDRELVESIINELMQYEY